MKYSAILFTVVVWGATLAFTRSILGVVSPSTVVFLRCLLGTLTMLVICGPYDWVKDFTLEQWAKAAVSGLVGVFGVQFVQGCALNYTSASHASWLVGSIPMLIAGMAVLFLKEKISSVRAAGFLLGFGGVLAVIFSKQSVAGVGIIPTGMGDMLSLTSCILWGVYAMLVSKWFEGVPQRRVTLINMAASLLVMTVIAWFDTGFSEFGKISFGGWINVIYLGVFCSGICYYLWNRSLEELGAQKAGSFIYIEPLVGVITSWLLLGEHISGVAFAGGALIMAGVYWINGGQFGTHLLRRFANFEIGF